MRNKVAVITGGSSGIGEALAYKFAQEGFNILIGGTNQERLKKVCSNIKISDVKCSFICHDVSNKKDIDKMIKKAIDDFGQIDVLANIAGGFLVFGWDSDEWSRAGKVGFDDGS